MSISIASAIVATWSCIIFHSVGIKKCISCLQDISLARIENSSERDSGCSPQRMCDIVATSVDGSEHAAGFRGGTGNLGNQANIAVKNSILLSQDPQLFKLKKEI